MFITFEGGEGSGKTTLIKKLATKLKQEGYDVITTREPGGSIIAEQIRSILLDKENTSLTAHTEALLFAASRAQHLDEVIIPALKLNKLILCDRYIDSSVAYQAFGRNLGVEFVYKINDYAKGYLPQLTFYLDIEPHIGENRVKNNRQNKIDRLDLETKDFHKRVADGYCYILKNEPKRVKRIDANRSVDEIFDEVLGQIKAVL